MITQVMGSQIYWIARISNDMKLKANAPDNVIHEQLLKSAKLSYNCAWLFVVLLFISLAVYTFIACFYTLTPSTKIGVVLYFVLLFCLIVLTFIPGSFFNKNIALLHVFRSEHFSKQCTAIKNSLQEQLYSMKFLFALFLLTEMVILPIIIRTFFVNTV